MLYNIRYWWFFLSQGNRWTKYLVHPKIRRPKTLPSDMCIFGRFGRLSSAAVHSADCRFDSRVKWWIHVLFIVTYLRKNSFLLRWNNYKQHSESSTHCWFWSTVSKRGTQIEHSFPIDKCSCEMVNTLPFDIFISTAISCIFNLRSAKTSLWRLAWWFECSPMARETWVQSQVESYQRLKKWYLLPPCLTLSITR